MDDDFKKKLILIGVVLVAVLAFYYIASPYQDCLSKAGERTDWSDISKIRNCGKITAW